MSLFLFFLVTCVLYPWRGIFASLRGADKSRDFDRSDPAVGQTEQANEDKEMNRLKSVIPLIDTDDNGQISVQELASRTERSMKAFYRQEATTRLKALDTNQNGKVSWEEYTKGAESREAFTDQQRKREKRRFANADLIKDGGLSSEELMSVFHPEESPHMFAVIFEEFMEFVDSDEDGSLSFDEYKASTVDLGKTNLRAAIESFKKLDNDQDGKLSKEEINVWLSAINTSSHARNQAQRLVAMADDNRDGVLSHGEMLNHMQLFTAGSEGYRSETTVKDEL